MTISYEETLSHIVPLIHDLSEGHPLSKDDNIEPDSTTMVIAVLMGLTVIVKQLIEEAALPTRYIQN